MDKSPKSSFFPPQLNHGFWVVVFLKMRGKTVVKLPLKDKVFQRTFGTPMSPGFAPKKVHL